MIDLLRFSRFNSLGNVNERVSSIVENDKINSSLHSATREIQSEVNQVHVLASGQTDYFEWCGGGSFSFHKAWDMIRRRDSTMTFHKVIWHAKNANKMSFISYLAANNRLYTKDRMVRFGMIDENTCCLCGHFEETVHHLFFECEYSSFIWRSVALKLELVADNSSVFENEAVKIMNAFKDKDQALDIACAAFTVAVYQIWMERNSHIFNNKCLDKVIRLRMIEREVQFLVNGNGSKTRRNRDKVEFLKRWGVELVDTG